VALELIQDTAASVAFAPEDLPARPASATLSFLSPGGDEKAAPAVTVATVGSGGSAGVATVASQTSITLDDATGVLAGGQVWVETSDGWKGAARISEVDGTAVTLDSAPPGTLTTAAVFYGLELSATIPATATGTRDVHYRLDWTITDSAGDAHKRRQMAHVCSMSFRDPVTSAEAARYMAATFPGFGAGLDAGHFRELARRATNRVRRMLTASGNYPHLVGDQDAFVDAGLVALRLELAQGDGLVPAGYDPSVYAADQERALRKAVSEAIASNWVDRDDDGSVDPDDVRPMWTVRAVRA